MSDNPTGIEDSLASAFNSSFAMPAVAPREATPTEPEAAEAAEPAAEAAGEEGAEGGAGEVDWKPEYEANLAAWREEADVAREKAAATRAAIEAEHAAAAKAKADAEKAAAQAAKDDKARKEREVRLAAALADEAPPTGPIHKRPVAPAASSSSSAPGTGDERNARVREAWELVKDKSKTDAEADAADAEAETTPAPSPSAPASASAWEEISAPHSSVEDISSSAPTSSPKAGTSSKTEKVEKVIADLIPPGAPATHASADAASLAPSLTLSFFTAPKSITVRRVLAALGINLLLPFINGIMLGLGEVTAREAVRVGRLWWRGERAVAGVWRRKDGSGTAGVGLSGGAGF